MTIECGEGNYLCVDAYQLTFKFFGVQARLSVGREQSPLAAWMFSDATRPSLNTEEPTLCIKCLFPCSEATCAETSVQITMIPFNQLADTIHRWVRQELPADAFRNRRQPQP